MFHKLFDIELAYQNLRQQLKKNASINYKLLSISGFFSLTLPESDQSKFYSYYLDIQPVMFELIYMNDFDFISPDEILYLSLQINKLKVLPVFQNKKDEFDDIGLYLEKIHNSILNKLTTYDAINDSVYKTDTLPVVLIEGNGTVNGICTAVIYSLNLSSSKRQKGEHTDKVEFKNIVDQSELEIVEQLNKVVKISKAECNRQKIKTGFYNFTYWFDNKDYIYTGTSLGAGAISLAFNSILINVLNEFYFRFCNDVVFTSEVDESGNLFKMDVKILKLKLHAVFFSSYKKFVIAEDNIIEAKNELKFLNEKYPYRNLEIIPVKNYSGIFKNPDILEKCNLKYIQKTSAIIQKHQKVINFSLAIISILILSFFVYKIILPMFDDNPVIKRYENDRLTAYNKNEKKLWESNFILNIANENFKVHDRAIQDNIILSDLDEDGKNEILTINTSSPDTIISRTVFCFENTGNLKWKFSAPVHNIYYSGNKFEDNFMYSLLVASDYKIKNHRYFVTSGNIKQYFPCELAIHNYDGNVISSYWHSGTLIQIKILDIDSDGREEIFASGVNNKSKTSCLAVFDPEIIRGSSFNTDPMKDSIKGTEKFYIIFPRTFFTALTPEGYSYAVSIYQKTPVRIVIEVVETINGNPYEELNPRILYEFDEKMILLNVILSSSFASRYEEMKSDSSKNLPVIKNWSQYQDSLKDAVRYWDGEKFVNSQVMNKYYLITKDSAKANQ